MELTRQIGFEFGKLEKYDVIILNKLAYQELLIRLEDDCYIPTEEEFTNDFACGKHTFFIVRRHNINYIIYYEELN